MPAATGSSQPLIISPLMMTRMRMNLYNNVHSVRLCVGILCLEGASLGLLCKCVCVRVGVCVFSYGRPRVHLPFSPWQLVLIGRPWGEEISCLAPNQHASLIYRPPSTGALIVSKCVCLCLSACASMREKETRGRGRELCVRGRSAVRSGERSLCSFC